MTVARHDRRQDQVPEDLRDRRADRQVVHAAGREVRQAEIAGLDGEEDQQQQPEPEARDRDADERQRRDDLIDPAEYWRTAV